MLAFSPSDVTSVAVFVHILVLAPGLGCALAADGLALSTLFRPLGPRGFKILGWLHTAILSALIFMWMSGLAMVAAKLMPGGAGLSPKLVIKLLTVVMLSANALAIGYVALPELRARQGQTFAAIPSRKRLQLGIIGGVSSACWATALALGLIDAFKSMGYGGLVATLGPMMAAGFALGLGVALAAPKIAVLSGAEPQPRSAV